MSRSVPNAVKIIFKIGKCNQTRIELELLNCLSKILKFLEKTWSFRKFRINKTFAYLFKQFSNKFLRNIEPFSANFFNGIDLKKLLISLKIKLFLKKGTITSHLRQQKLVYCNLYANFVLQKIFRFV